MLSPSDADRRRQARPRPQRGLRQGAPARVRTRGARRGDHARRLRQAPARPPHRDPGARRAGGAAHQAARRHARGHPAAGAHDGLAQAAETVAAWSAGHGGGEGLMRTGAASASRSRWRATPASSTRSRRTRSPAHVSRRWPPRRATWTRQLAHGNLVEERAMQDYLARRLPELAAGRVHDEIPISEIKTPRKKPAAKKKAHLVSERQESGAMRRSPARSRPWRAGARARSWPPRGRGRTRPR